MNTKIEAIEIYLPNQLISSEEIVNNCLNDISFPLERFTGIKQRAVSAEEYSGELAYNAIIKLITKHSINPSEIDLIIGGSVSKMMKEGTNYLFESSLAQKMKNDFGFSNSICFDVSNACAGVWTGIYIANSFIKSGKVKKAIVFSGEYITHLTKTAQKEIESILDPRIPCLTLGDSGIAVLLSYDDTSSLEGIVELQMRSIPVYNDLCIAKPTSKSHGGAIMHTNMIKLGAVGVQEAVKQAVRVIKDSDTNISEIDYLIPHQVSKTSFNEAINQFNSIYGRKLFSEDKLINNLENRGNTASTAIIVAFYEAMAHGIIKDNQKILFGISGSGITAGGCIYNVGNLPSRTKQKNDNSFNEFHLNKSSSEIVTKVIEPQKSYILEKITKSSIVGHTDDMIVSAGVECLNNISIEKCSIRHVIHCGIYRSEFIIEPTVASIVMNRLGINESSTADNENFSFGFDITNGQSGFLLSCLIASNYEEPTLIITSDNCEFVKSNIGLNVQDFATCSLIKQCEEGSGILLYVIGSVANSFEKRFSHSHWQGNKTIVEIVESDDFQTSCCQLVKQLILNILDKSELKIDEISNCFISGLNEVGVSEIKSYFQIDSENMTYLLANNDKLTSTIPYLLSSSNIFMIKDKHYIIIEVGSGINGVAVLYKA